MFKSVPGGVERHDVGCRPDFGDQLLGDVRCQGGDSGSGEAGDHGQGSWLESVAERCVDFTKTCGDGTDPVAWLVIGVGFAAFDPAGAFEWVYDSHVSHRSGQV
ncbi:hypothetical protein AWC18_01455 [Mycolicibacter nonchromogenicus]|uniref:Uncharacterized protein n=1 Tax=Mycolicibacter nonchromogenicus TaxID=1782 RepID=A0A1X1ZRX2_MYCNO|nr:hypothetical protein AWC18_01455 [Mycolicibacter nonchromogenicus]